MLFYVYHELDGWKSTELLWGSNYLGWYELLSPKKWLYKNFLWNVWHENLIVAPTYLRGPVPTLLDVILVTKPRRFARTLNCEYILSDFQNFIGTATKKYAPTAEPRKIIYRSYKTFNDLQFIDNVISAPFHVAKIFDVDDASWFTSSLLNDIIDYHAPCKTKVVKCESGISALYEQCISQGLI